MQHNIATSTTYKPKEESILKEKSLYIQNISVNQTQVLSGPKRKQININVNPKYNP